MKDLANKLLLINSVGNNFSNEENDVLAVKKQLSKRGFYTRNVENGIIDTDTTQAIKNFQIQKSLKIDGVMMPSGETEKAMNADNGYENTVRARRNQIINNLNDFEIHVNAHPFPENTMDYIGNEFQKSWGKLIQVDRFSDVKKYESLIDEKAKKIGVDPDLAKSIMHLETTHGYYDEPMARIDKDLSIRPMNVHSSYWNDLGYTRSDLRQPAMNIEAGIKIIKGISDRVPDKDIAKIGTLYNSLGAMAVTPYGEEVKEFYNAKPWKNNNE